MFGVNVTNTATKNTVIGESSFVTIRNSSSVIKVDIMSSDLSPGSHSSDFFLLASSPKSSTGGSDVDSDSNDFTYSWSSSPSCNGKIYSQIDIVQGVTSLTSPTDQYLKFAPGALSSGETYCFAVNVEDGNGSNGTASIAVKVRDAPNGGVCSVLGNSKGAPLSTTFSFQCNGWTTDALSYPLRYGFNIRKLGSSNSEWSILASPSFKPSYSTVLMSGTYEIQAQILDATGSMNFIPQVMR
jgi:hypothetical protein